MKCRSCEMSLRHFGITKHLVNKISHKDPGVPYSLSTANIKLADSRAESIVTPLHIDHVPGAIFTKTSNPMTGNRYVHYAYLKIVENYRISTA